jgi:hypothetical protein
MRFRPKQNARGSRGKISATYVEMALEQVLATARMCNSLITHFDGMCNPLDWHMNSLHRFQQW